MNPKLLKAIIGIILLLIPAIFGSDVILASETQRRIEQENRKELEQTELKILKGERRLLFDYGGWLNVRYIDYNEDDNDSATSDIIDYTGLADLRFWLKATLKPDFDSSGENEHSLYIRLKDLYSENKPDDTAGGWDHDGPHIDYAYCVLDLRPAWLKIGRAYFAVGRGIAYSNVNDGAEFQLYLQNWRFKSFASATLTHEDNIDLTVPGYDKNSDRFYYGLECNYTGIPRHNLYGYTLIQKDFSNENPEDSEHDFAYNCEYFGLGAEGYLKPKLSYWLELIKQAGSSFIYSTNEKKDVDAWAAVLGLDYKLSVFAEPSFIFEYAFGSGDPDRTSVTDTQNGNSSGKDKNFLYLGYTPTGYALSPRLSNLHMYRLGVLFNPFDRITILKNFDLGVDYYRYYKDKAGAGIYDIDATEDSDDVGYEIDIKAAWQIFSDLRFSFQYGYFKPGDAYPDSNNDSEEYLSLSMIITF